jgi:peptide/nickel transport system permease protein
MIKQLSLDSAKLLKKSPKFRLGFAITLAMVFLSVVGLIASPYADEGWGLVSPEALTRQGLPPCLPFSCPSLSHLFGTDEMGRDLLSRILVGTHIALLQVVSVLLLSLFLGIFLGILAGYSNRVVEKLLTYLTELFMVMPSFIVAAAFVVVFSRGMLTVIMALVLTWWPWYAKTAYTIVRGLRELDFIVICEVMGASRAYIIFKHILPNTLPIVLVQAIGDAGSIAIEIASINFLIGTASAQSIDLPEWGMIMGYGLRYIRTYWWITIYPGTFLLILALGLVLMGDGLSEYISPVLRRRWKSWI